MKNILVATDLTQRSDRALARALRLAGPDSRVRVLHVVDEDLPEHLFDRMREHAEKAVDAQIAASMRPEGTVVERQVSPGAGYRTILAQAREIDADVIVAGTHREDSLGGYFLGTTIERVIRAGERPVLMVSEPATAPYRRVMVCVDFSVHSRRAVECALELVPGAEMTLLHAYDVPFAGFITDAAAHDEVRSAQQERLDGMMGEEMKAFVASLQHPPASLRQLLGRGSAREVIRREAAKADPDLLVIGTHGRTGVSRAFLGSVAEELLDDPPCDVLAVKAW